jgi:hypothetical protein
MVVAGHSYDLYWLAELLVSRLQQRLVSRLQLFDRCQFDRSRCKVAM